MRLSYELEARRPPQIGLIVLQSDETIEPDMQRLLPGHVELLVSRVPSGTEVTSETLSAMQDHLTRAASLLPGGARFSAVGYGCTSGTAEIGAERVAELVRAGVDTPAVTNPASALIAACAHLGVTRLGLVSPYIASVSNRLREVLGAAGITTPGFGSFDEPLEANVVRISSASVEAAALAVADSADCDAVFLSCTNLRTLDVIAPLEARLGKPVLSSNLVLAWHLCRLAGQPPAETAPGRLFGETRAN